MKDRDQGEPEYSAVRMDIRPHQGEVTVELIKNWISHIETGNQAEQEILAAAEVYVTNKISTAEDQQQKFNISLYLRFGSKELNIVVFEDGIDGHKKVHGSISKYTGEKTPGETTMLYTLAKKVIQKICNEIHENLIYEDTTTNSAMIAWVADSGKGGALVATTEKTGDERSQFFKIEFHPEEGV